MILDSTAVRLEAELAQVQALARVPSMTAAVLQSGELAWSGSRGTAVRAGESVRASFDTQYRIGSITKTLTAALVMQLRDEGRLELSDLVSAHVREGPFADATIRGLLSHGAGLPAEPVGPWWERSEGGDYATLVAANTDATRVLPVGERYHYSNLAFAILARVVEVLRGEPWIAVLRDRVVEPLRMTRTTYGPAGDHADGFSVDALSGMLTSEPHQDTGAMAPAGQLWSTTADLCRWMHELSRADPEVLSSAAVTAMTTPQSADPTENLTGAYGLGLRLSGPGPLMLVGHTGSMPGFLAGMFVDRGTGVGAVVLANASYGLDVEGLTRSLVRTVLELEPAIRPEWTPTNSIDDATRELLGTWFWGNAPFTMVVDRGVLSLRAVTSVRGFDFEPAGLDTWVGTSGYQTGETLRVVRRPDGSISHLDVGTFCYTRVAYDPSAPVPGGPSQTSP